MTESERWRSPSCWFTPAAFSQELGLPSGLQGHSSHHPLLFLPHQHGAELEVEHPAHKQGPIWHTCTSGTEDLPEKPLHGPHISLHYNRFSSNFYTHIFFQIYLFYLKVIPRDIFYLMVHFPNVCNGQRWVHPKPGHFSGSPM